MKLPAFDHSKKEWDAWNAFHIVHSYYPFVQFDTGEFVVCSNSWRPEHRQVYRDLNIQIVATDDDNCPQLFVPGAAKPVFKSHLNHNGMQTLLLDLDHKRAVALGPSLAAGNAPMVPERFFNHRVTAYYPGPAAPPVGGPVTRHYPQPLTNDQRKHVAELVDASKVWLEMQPNPPALAQQHRKQKFEKLHVRDFVDVSFGVLTPAHRVTIALDGFNTIVKDEHPWLTFNYEGVTQHDSKDD